MTSGANRGEDAANRMAATVRGLLGQGRIRDDGGENEEGQKGRARATPPQVAQEVVATEEKRSEQVRSGGGRGGERSKAQGLPVDSNGGGRV